MINKLVVLAPSGGLASYLSLNLLKIPYKNSVSYHDQFYSLYSNVFETIDVDKFLTNDEFKCMQIHNWCASFEKFFHYPNVKVVQIIFDKFPELILLNWYLKRPKQEIKNWIDWQTGLWKNIYKCPVEAAVLDWMQKFYNNQFKDIKKIEKITNIFNFSYFYENFYGLKKQFNNLNVEYTKKQHEDFLKSQKEVIDIWNSILSCYLDNPMKLNDPFLRGLALGLNSVHFNTSQQQTITKYCKYNYVN